MPHLNAESLTTDTDGLEFLHNVLHEDGASARPTAAALRLRSAAMLQTSSASGHLTAEPLDLTAQAELRGVLLSLA